MPQVRCSYCQARRTLKHAPTYYLRIPTCKTPGCNNKRKRLGKPIRYYIDNWRMLHEVGAGAPKPCNCGWVFGPTGEFPHRRASGTCAFNPAMQERE